MATRCGRSRPLRRTCRSTTSRRQRGRLRVARRKMQRVELLCGEGVHPIFRYEALWFRNLQSLAQFFHNGPGHSRGMRSRQASTCGRSARSGHRGPSFTNRPVESEHRASRRQAPPPSIEIPAPFPNPTTMGDPNATDITPTATQSPEQTTLPLHTTHQHHHSHWSQDASQTVVAPLRHHLQPLATALPSMDAADRFNLRLVRDIDRLPLGRHHETLNWPGRRQRDPPADHQATRDDQIPLRRSRCHL